MEKTFIDSSLAILVIIMLGSFAHILSKKIKIPYTILLLLFGFMLIPLSHISFFHFITEFSLTPELLFIVFLPILIFESGYTMGYREILKNWKSISLLAIVGLMISAFVIGFGLHYIFDLVGINIPLSVTILFGSIISATDTVSVLALFKQFGAPKRLVLLFEGESVFNDGTTLALFFVVLEVINKGVIGSENIIYGILTFISMVIGGVLFGGFMGTLFSKIIEKIKGNENIEVVFTMVVAYMTFILSELISEYVSIGEFHFKISGVIATALAAIVIGNYGRYKISYKVQDYLEKFWTFAAFLVNSLIFVLMGNMLMKLNIDYHDFIIPIIITILTVIVARGISVYLPLGFLNLTKTEEQIPSSWQHLLAWGSLRGVISMMMVMMIPNDFTISGWHHAYTVKEFLLSISIGTIMFTLLIKSTTIGWLLKRLGINKLYEQEIFEKQESNIIINTQIIDRLKVLQEKGQITKIEYDILNKSYGRKLKSSISALKKFLEKRKNGSRQLLIKIISLHALGAEKYYLKELFRYNIIDEYIFKYMLRNVDKKIEIVEDGQEWVKSEGTTIEIKLIDKFLNYLSTRKDNIVYKYIKHKTKYVIANRIIDELEKLKKFELGIDIDIFDEVIDNYKKFGKRNKKEMEQLYKDNQNLINLLDIRIIKKSLIRLEEKTLKTLYNKEYITNKLYVESIEHIDAKISKDINSLA